MDEKMLDHRVEAVVANRYSKHNQSSSRFCKVGLHPLPLEGSPACALWGDLPVCYAFGITVPVCI